MLRSNTRSIGCARGVRQGRLRPFLSLAVRKGGAAQTKGTRTPMTESTANDQTPITIKKYANRRLYNTATSSYVTLDHLAEMVKDGTDFVVYDAKTGEDITRQVLTHIIVEDTTSI